MIETSKAGRTLYLWQVGQTSRDINFLQQNLSSCIYVSSYDDDRQNEPTCIIRSFVEGMYGVLGLQCINLGLK
jgi:hypothetical protein